MKFCKCSKSLLLILITLSFAMQSLAKLPFCGSKIYGNCEHSCRTYLKKCEEVAGKCCCTAIDNSFYGLPAEFALIKLQ